MKSRNDARCGEVNATAVAGLPEESTMSRKEPDLFEAKSMAELMEESRVLNDPWPARDLMDPDFGLGKRWGRRGCWDVEARGGFWTVARGGEKERDGWMDRKAGKWREREKERERVCVYVRARVLKRKKWN
jgi:hypothetical protein